MSQSTALTRQEEFLEVVSSRPSIEIDKFEKIQSGLLEKLEKDKVRLIADFEARKDDLGKFYDVEISDKKSKIDVWNDLIKSATSDMSKLEQEKRENLNLLREQHDKEIAAQERMIRFQRNGLTGLKLG